MLCKKKVILNKGEKLKPRTEASLNHLKQVHMRYSGIKEQLPLGKENSPIERDNKLIHYLKAYLLY